MSDLRLIDRNPVIDAFRESERSNTEQRHRDFRLNEAKRLASEAVAVDKALREETLRTQQPQTMAPTGFAPQAAPSAPQAPLSSVAPAMPAAAPMAPAAPQQQPAPAPQPQPRANYAGALARVPGGGAMSAEMTMAADAERDKKQASALMAWAAYSNSGSPMDLQVAKIMSEQSGLRLPPGVEDDARAAGIVSRGMLLAEKLYRGDPEFGRKFLGNWMQGQGNLEAAIAATGAPRNGKMSLKTILHEGKRQLALIDQTSGVATPVTMGGQPVEMPSPSEAGAPADLKMVRFLLDEGIAKSPAEAWAMARQSRQNPQTLYTRVYTGVYNGLVKNFTDPDEAHAQATQRAQQVMQNLYPQGDPTALMMNTGDAPAPAAPAPAQPDQGGGSTWYNPFTWGDDGSNVATTPNSLGQGGGAQQPFDPAQATYEALASDGQTRYYSTDGVNWYLEDGSPVPTQ